MLGLGALPHSSLWPKTTPRLARKMQSPYPLLLISMGKRPSWCTSQSCWRLQVRWRRRRRRGAVLLVPLPLSPPPPLLLAHPASPSP